MNCVIFGLTITSAWGNGHATLWRGLCRALSRRGHEVQFFERDVPYYASHRDLARPEGCRLYLYRDWTSVRAQAEACCREADVAMVTSYCPDGPDAAAVILDSRAAIKVFYDMDTPVTLNRLEQGDAVPYLPPGGLGHFDLVLSYTGGRALDELRRRLGARRVAPLYGCVDPAAHRQVGGEYALRSDLSYLGTYAQDRQTRLRDLFIEPARRRPNLRFLIGGSLYPADFPWTDNMFYLRHMPPQAHPAFFCSSALTLNVTREAMARLGYCPSGRLFEAAACGTPIVTDAWEGLTEFFTPGEEVLVATSTEDVLGALEMTREARVRLAHAARERVLSQHTADCRARELERVFGNVRAADAAFGAAAVE